MRKSVSHLELDEQDGEPGSVQVLAQQRNVEELRLAKLGVVNQKPAGPKSTHTRLKRVDTGFDGGATGRIGGGRQEPMGGPLERIGLRRKGIDASKTAGQIIAGYVRPHGLELVEQDLDPEAATEV